MKIKCLKKDLETALLAAQKVVSKQTNLPVLENVLFEARGDELYIKATNIEVFFEYKITVSIEKDGEFAVPAEILLQVIKGSSGNKKVELNLEGNNLQIKDENGNYTIKTVNHEEFPKLQKPEKLKDVKNKINKELLLNGIKSVYQFSSNMLVKPELSSVYIYSDAEDFVFVATDQFRLAEKKIKFGLNDEFDNILLPNKNANILIKILESTEEENFKLLSEENQLSLQSENMFLSSRILDLSFPDYKVIIPKDIKTKVIVLKSDFLEALRKTTFFTDKFGKVEFSISTEDGKLKIKSQNQTVGEMQEEIKAKIDGEKEFSLNFNYKYLLEGASMVNGDSLQFLYSSDNAPLIIKGVGDNSFTYIVMVMNK